MDEPRVTVFGVYRVEPTEALFVQAMRFKYAGMDLAEHQHREAEAAVREELSAVVLFEVEVQRPDEQFDVSDFGQPDSDQAPYDEAFLTPNGAGILSRMHAPSGDSLRVAFFLHYYDSAKPLRTSYGLVAAPPPTSMPRRLSELLPYTPVD